MSLGNLLVHVSCAAHFLSTGPPEVWTMHPFLFKDDSGKCSKPYQSFKALHTLTYAMQGMQNYGVAWKTYIVVSCCAWIASAVFHARDTSMTERLDYMAAFATVVTGLAVCVMRCLSISGYNPFLPVDVQPGAARLSKHPCVCITIDWIISSYPGA